MSMITDAIMKQMKTIGEPRVSKVTENITQNQQQPMNFANLALLAWLMMDANKDKTTTTLGETPLPPSRNIPQASGLSTPTPSPSGTVSSQQAPMDFIRMLLSFGAGGR